MQKMLGPNLSRLLLLTTSPKRAQFRCPERPFRESTGTLDKTEARRKLKQREGEVTEGRFRGVRMDRTRFEELTEDLKVHYTIAGRHSGRRVQRLEEAPHHLLPVFRGYRAMEITSEKIARYMTRRKEEGSANGTINRELGTLRAMFRLGMKRTPAKVAQVPHIPQLIEGKRSGFFEHEDFLALRGALPDYVQVPVTLAYYSGMRMGEVFSLELRQVSWQDSKIYLEAEDTKTDEPRVLYMTDDLRRVLEAWRHRTVERWPLCKWICHGNGHRLSKIVSAWQRGCKRVGLGNMIHDSQKARLVWQGKIPHDFRRTAIRNMVRAGISERVAMTISGHKTRAVFDRYNIVNEADLKAPASRLSGYFSKEMGTISGIIEQLTHSPQNATVDKSAQDFTFSQA